MNLSSPSLPGNRESFVLVNGSDKANEFWLEPLGDWMVFPPQSRVRVETLPYEHPVELAFEQRGLVVYAHSVRVILLAGKQEWELDGDSPRRWPSPAMSYVKTLHSALQDAPFPELGKQIGNFGAWESLLAGLLDCVQKGAPLDTRALYPVADERTLKEAAAIHAKKMRTPEERAFLDYFELLEEVRIIIMWAWRAKVPAPN